MDLRNFFPQMESACGECDNEEDIVLTSPSSDFVTTNSQALGGSVCLKGGLSHFPPKFKNIFMVVITFFPFLLCK